MATPPQMPFRPRFSEPLKIEDGRGLHTTRPWGTSDAHRKADGSCAGRQVLHSEPKSEPSQLAKLRVTDSRADVHMC